MNEKIKGWVRERLQGEDWELLFKRTVAMAEQEIRRRRWRGSKDGLLPEGHDANSVAAEVVAGMLAGKGGLTPGWTRERLERELGRRVSNKVRRLHALKETSQLGSGWEIGAAAENGRSAWAFVESEIPDGFEFAAQREEEVERRRVEKRMAERLKGDDEAQKVLRCLCRGLVKRQDIVKRLGISVQAVTTARKRLRRKCDI